jgi:hypothetical protein
MITRSIRVGVILNFFLLHSVLTNAVQKGLNLRMHTGLWKASSRHVMGILTRVAHPPTQPIFQRITLEEQQWSCRGMLPSLRTAKRSFCVSSAGSCLRLRTTYRSPITLHNIYARHISWTPKLNPRPVEFNGLSDEQEDAAKAAILEKVMKGRQPTDLMLRCKLSLL